MAGLLAIAASPASAQFIGQAVGGMTSAADQQLFLAGSLGKQWKVVQADVEIGRMRDILPKGLFDAFNNLQEDIGLPVRAVARLTNTYVSGNVRFITPGGRVRPFVGGGAGLAHLQPKFEVTVQQGDFQFNLGDVFGTTHVDPINKLMLNAGGGLSFELGPSATLDAGYRYVMIDTDYEGFGVTGVGVRAHVIYLAFGGRF